MCIRACALKTSGLGEVSAGKARARIAALRLKEEGKGEEVEEEEDEEEEGDHALSPACCGKLHLSAADTERRSPWVKTGENQLKILHNVEVVFFHPQPEKNIL